LAFDPNLSIEGLRAGYGALDILNGVDLTVHPGDFIALMGPNGAGKSTLLMTIFGMTTFKQGMIRAASSPYAGSPTRITQNFGASRIKQQQWRVG
jgi:branched-chain amino acid transport system ATP-binding protein